MTTLLSEDIPMRTTAEWPGARQIGVVIPDRYGVCRGAPLQMTKDRLSWLWAGHAVKSIDEVTVGGLPLPEGSWSWSNGLDPAGKPAAIIVLAQPLPEGTDISASGQGKLDADTGALIDNPADILFDILNVKAGRSEMTRLRLAPFRAECARSAIAAGGSVDSAGSVQAACRSICASVGARFAPGSRGIAFLYPVLTPGVARATISERNCASLVPTASWTDVATSLTVSYAYEGGQPTATLQLLAPGAIRRFGNRPRPSTLEAPWIASAAVALAVGTRVLQQSARKQWNVVVADARVDVRTGDYVQIDHPLLAANDPVPVLARTSDFQKVALTLRVPLGPIPGIVIGQQSAQFDPNQYASATLTIQGPDRIIGIDDNDGNPLAGAAVFCVEANVTHYTNGQGDVRFSEDELPSGATYTFNATSADGSLRQTFQLTF